MSDHFLKIVHIVGFNRAIGYGVLARAWSLVAGPITILMIVSHYSKEQQGFYYTISSLLGLQIFFELGLVYVLAQFVSHEFAFLAWGEKGAITGDPVAMARLHALLRKSLNYFGLASLLLIVVLIPTGLAFLGRQEVADAGFSWRLPWVLAVCVTAANLMVVPFYAVIMGSGDVVTVNHREMVGAMVSSCAAWVVIGLNGGLYAVFAISLGTFFVSSTYLVRQKPELLKLAITGILGRRRVNEGAISWRHEVWPLQWKMALSWASGYFMFQLFNPVLFHYHGPVVAGQMGMTLSVSNALLTGCATWMNSRSPEFGKMIAMHEWEKLDGLFNRVMRQSIGVAIAAAVVGWVIILYLQDNYSIGNRFVSSGIVALLFGSVFLQVIYNGIAIYLRSHKKEPLMWLSIIAAVLQGGTTWYLGMKYAAKGVTVGVLIVYMFVVLPVSFIIFLRCRDRWHSDKSAIGITT